MAGGREIYNSHYLEQIEKKATQLGFVLDKLSAMNVPNEEFSSIWPNKPDMTDTWPMAVLAQEMDDTELQEDLTILHERTIDQIGFEPEGDAIPSAVERFLLSVCLADPSIRPSPPFEILDLGEVYRDAPYVESEGDRKLVGLFPNLRRPRGGYRGRGR